MWELEWDGKGHGRVRWGRFGDWVLIDRKVHRWVCGIGYISTCVVLKDTAAIVPFVFLLALVADSTV